MKSKVVQVDIFEVEGQPVEGLGKVFYSLENGLAVKGERPENQEFAGLYISDSCAVCTVIYRVTRGYECYIYVNHEKGGTPEHPIKMKLSEETHICQGGLRAEFMEYGMNSRHTFVVKLNTLDDEGKPIWKVIANITTNDNLHIIKEQLWYTEAERRRELQSII